MANQGQLRIDDVSKSFRVSGNSLRVLDSLNLAVEPGGFLTIVGASGCGKSTLLRLVAGLDTDFDGEVSLDGELVAAPSLDRGLVFQEPRLFPWLTVAQNVALGLLNAGLGKTERQRAVAEQEDEETARRLLGNARAALCALAAFACDPRLVWYAQEARPYAAALFFSMLSFLLYAQLLERESAPLRAGFVAASAAAFYAHYLFGLGTVVQALHALLAREPERARARAWLLSFAAVSALPRIVPSTMTSALTLSGYLSAAS